MEEMNNAGTSRRRIVLKISGEGFCPAHERGIVMDSVNRLASQIAEVAASGIEMGLKIVFAYFLIPKIGFLGTVITEPIIWIICGIYILVIYLWKKKALLGNSSSEKVA